MRCMFCEAAKDSMPQEAQPISRYCRLLESACIMKLTRACVHCGESFNFHASKPNRKFCSRKCYNEHTIARVERVCETCGKTFFIWPSQIKHNEGKYCSIACTKNSVAKICIVCGKSFEVCKSRNDKYPNLYCSKKCYGKDLLNNRIKRVCKCCNKEFFITESKSNYGFGVFCSKECQSKFCVQENSSRWEGGKTELQKIIRMHSKSAEWKTGVFQRDNFRDWFSGCKGELEAHHVVKFSDLLKKYNITTLQEALDCDPLWDISNGVTMLKSTHRAYHEMW